MSNFLVTVKLLLTNKIQLVFGELLVMFEINFPLLKDVVLDIFEIRLKKKGFLVQTGILAIGN